MTRDRDDGHALAQPLDPCRAAVPTRPLCAASERLGRRHRVGVAGYLVRDRDGHVWRLCSPGCAMVWSGGLAARPGRIVPFRPAAGGAS
jgi:hypothetical protein